MELSEIKTIEDVNTWLEEQEHKKGMLLFEEASLLWGPFKSRRG